MANVLLAGVPYEARSELEVLMSAIDWTYDVGFSHSSALRLSQSRSYDAAVVGAFLAKSERDISPDSSNSEALIKRIKLTPHNAECRVVVYDHFLMTQKYVFKGFKRIKKDVDVRPFLIKSGAVGCFSTRDLRPEEFFNILRVIVQS